MRIKFWGTRGSIPVSDARMIRYGGNTTCVEVSCGNRILIIDAGTGIRKLGESLAKRKITDFDIFITHSHWDHIQGFPFFAPIYSPKSHIHILGCSHSYRRLKEILSHQMSQEYFPVSFSDLKSKIEFYDTCHDFYSINGFKLDFIQTNHPVFTLAVKVTYGTTSFVMMTDNELGSAKPQTPYEDLVEFCKGATCLVHDAQFTAKEYEHDRSGWGHSTYDQAIKLAQDAGVKTLGFFHHDPNRKDAELARIEHTYNGTARKKRRQLRIFAAKEMSSITL